MLQGLGQWQLLDEKNDRKKNKSKRKRVTHFDPG